MWGAAVNTTSLPVAGSGQIDTSSVSAAWHSPAHNYPNNSNSTVDNEFDMLGTRSRSPMVTSSMACTIPSHNQFSLGMLSC